jgi:hypothetical protein
MISQQHDEENDTFWYFAIGSMMSPISMENRGILPIQSVPGELIDYELLFSGGMGFAEAKARKHSSFHGVLHLVDKDTMDRLDKLEIAYTRVDGTAHMYDGRTVTATVYTKDASSKYQENNPPHQRYLDVMIEGLKHYKVNQKQIDLMEKQQCIPRPKPHEFKSVGEVPADAPLLEYENDVLPYNGIDTPQLRLTVNGKVMEINIDDAKDQALIQRSLNIYKQYGQRLEMVFSRVLYDPVYGCPEKLEVSLLYVYLCLCSYLCLTMILLICSGSMIGLYKRTQ